jgi:cobalt-zinc-cadmium efflux system protein
MTSHHHHNHEKKGVSGRNLLISIILNLTITLAQVVGGIISGSLSLLSDALHNFSDVVSLIISYAANVLARKEASTDRTFGYKRAEIMAAFINAASLVIIGIYLIYEAVHRLIDPSPIQSNLVIWLALLGIVVNGFSVLLLQKDAAHNLNMRSAYLHLFTDLAASVAVLIGGLLMKYLGWFWVDAILTILIALYLVYLSYDLLRSTYRILMLFTPADIDLNKVRTTISDHPRIDHVHHVHIWQLNEDETHFEAHIDFADDITLSEFDDILVWIEEQLLKHFGINHVTIQPEYQKQDNKAIIVQD